MKNRCNVYFYLLTNGACNFNCSNWANLIYSNDLSVIATGTVIDFAGSVLGLPLAKRHHRGAVEFPTEIGIEVLFQFVGVEPKRNKPDRQYN